ncbi:unnamed protein product [Linum tenue]|uniref:Uncharacterized protein n=1 Tax=Linum tenue TaxID=586396 RepID=A0AAV0KKN5_9ROSI|nr:unnamed protein product [Linum tenue]
MHFLWSTEEFGDTFNYLAFGFFRDLDPVSPFLKLEVIPSTSHAPAVHLRCPYNNRYLMVVPQREHLVIAGESEMRDDPNDQTSTLFYPSFPYATDNLVGFYHNATNRNVRVSQLENPFVVALSPPAGMEYFRYFPYESYDETMARKDEEIKAITESLEEFKGSNGESLSPEELIGQLRERIAEQNRELEELYDQIGGRPNVVKAAQIAGATA